MTGWMGRVFGPENPPGMSFLVSSCVSVLDGP